MSKSFRYKQYLNRAFWNSLIAVTCALVLVFIAVYGIKILTPTSNDNNYISEPESQVNLAEFERKMQILNSLSDQDGSSQTEENDMTNNDDHLSGTGQAGVSSEKISILEDLSAGNNSETNLTPEEQKHLLDSL